MLCIVDIDTGSDIKDKRQREIQQEIAAKDLQALFEISMRTARLQAKQLPPLYKSGVKYANQPKEACAFRPPKDVYERKNGDCKQLVLWRLAELRNAGEAATSRIIWLADKEGFFAHAQVRRANGTIEDPSVNLGMKRIT